MLFLACVRKMKKINTKEKRLKVYERKVFLNNTDDEEKYVQMNL